MGFKGKEHRSTNSLQEQVGASNEVAQGLIGNDALRDGLSQAHGVCLFLLTHLQLPGIQQGGLPCHLLKPGVILHFGRTLSDDLGSSHNR